jgi:glutamyl-tRNA reductase
LLHVPTVRARELAANGQQDAYVAGLEALYGITVDPSPATTAATVPGPAASEADCPVEHSHAEHGPAAGDIRETA